MILFEVSDINWTLSYKQNSLELIYFASTPINLSRFYFWEYILNES